MSDLIRPVLVTCPNTGQVVETVLRLRVSAFEALAGQYSFRCTRCGEAHSWRKEDAWLKPAPQAPAPVQAVSSGS